ncbi:flagellar biosynthesis protein FlgN [Sphingomonas morindae]|uniref:Flagellar biosynthesis protein FlgN n=1 Tax=Sphingomonas morindae TaxID=1541170 RepID=A0ABY4X535_9SPHN|nr:flagellar biosynthesis protein FlgN [Sphingomonas morindae]USI72009.1 flagellar biosynthesis protein FlgN [Sphingomonas morindae]
MVAELIELMHSLTLVIREETEVIEAHGRSAELRELVRVKHRLIGIVESELARRDREAPGWAQALDEADRARFLPAVEALCEASDANATLLRRRLELTGELIQAMTNEARRLSNRNRFIYGADGDMAPPTEMPPISFNNRF